MSTDNWVLFSFCAYVVIFLFTTLGLAIWRAKSRRERPPLEFKLLRGPGEGLRRRVAKFDEDCMFRVGGAALIPIFAALIVFGPFLKFFPPQTMTQLRLGIAATAGVFLVTLIVSLKWALRDLERYRNDALGYLGERAVGEALEALRADGFRIFHDVPAEGKKGEPFNVDHVAVGPTGLFSIETKTRRKGRTRPGFEAHKVAYDGKRLIWPWAEDDFGLRQAEARARWLSDWLNNINGFGLAAQPVLVLPGWYVVPKGVGPVTVLNHKQLCGAITRGSKNVLTPDQIGLIARQLDDACRDVQD